MPVTPNGPAVPVAYCVFVSGQNVFGSAGNWDAKVCTEKLGYICQADSTVDIVIPDVIMRKWISGWFITEITIKEHGFEWIKVTRKNVIRIRIRNKEQLNYWTWRTIAKHGGDKPTKNTEQQPCIARLIYFLWSYLLASGCHLRTSLHSIPRWMLLVCTRKEKSRRGASVLRDFRLLFGHA